MSGWFRRVPQPAKMPRRWVGGLSLRNPKATMVLWTRVALGFYFAAAFLL